MNQILKDSLLLTCQLSCATNPFISQYLHISPHLQTSSCFPLSLLIHHPYLNSKTYPLKDSKREPHSPTLSILPCHSTPLHHQHFIPKFLWDFESYTLITSHMLSYMCHFLSLHIRTHSLHSHKRGKCKLTSPFCMWNSNYNKIGTSWQAFRGGFSTTTLVKWM